MRNRHLSLFLLAVIGSLFHACIAGPTSNLSLANFAFLERGMTYEQIVDGLGEPHDRIEGSTAFVTLVYELEDGERLYLGFYAQANYLDSVYYQLPTNGAEETKWLVPSPVDFPPGIRRELTLDDFEEITAGISYFPDVYRKVGSPNVTGYFGSGIFGMVYYLREGARLSLISHDGYGCITTVNYSPESFGPNWTALSEDTQGLCDEK